MGWCCYGCRCAEFSDGLFGFENAVRLGGGTVERMMFHLSLDNVGEVGFGEIWLVMIEWEVLSGCFLVLIKIFDVG